MYIFNWCKCKLKIAVVAFRGHFLFMAEQGLHYDDVTMSVMASQITSFTIVYSTVYSDPDQRKHQSSASLAFVQGIHRWPVNSPHKWPVTLKMSPFDDVIMQPARGGVEWVMFSQICRGLAQTYPCIQRDPGQWPRTRNNAMARDFNVWFSVKKLLNLCLGSHLLL